MRITAWLSRSIARLVHYVSTYCMHGRHEECRETCKICNAPCRCACHRV